MINKLTFVMIVIPMFFLAVEAREFRLQSVGFDESSQDTACKKAIADGKAKEIKEAEISKIDDCKCKQNQNGYTCQVTLYYHQEQKRIESSWPGYKK